MLVAENLEWFESSGDGDFTQKKMAGVMPVVRMGALDFSLWQKAMFCKEVVIGLLIR